MYGTSANSHHAEYAVSDAQNQSCIFQGEKFYKGALHAHPTVSTRVLEDNVEEHFLNTPVEFIDTAGCGFNEAVNPETYSISNPEEANVLFIHLQALLDRYYRRPERKAFHRHYISVQRAGTIS